MRQRSKVACSTCRQHKRKCDGKKPCAFCVNFEYSCTYEEKEQPASPTKRAASTASLSVQTNPPKRKSIASDASEDSYHRDEDGSIQQELSSPLMQDILRSQKARFMNSHSAFAFPRVLGLDLQTAEPPRIDAFAYHAGIRKEPGAMIHTTLAQFISLDQAQRCFDVYASLIHPLYDFMDIHRFRARCEHPWTCPTEDIIFEATVGGVMVLGSLFAPRLMTEEQEFQVVLHVKNILEDSHIVRQPQVEQIVAWILRTIYLRGTTTPHAAWLASCNTMHLVEACGLHLDLDDKDTTMDLISPLYYVSKRVFGMALALNRLISFEYGRSYVSIPNSRRMDLETFPVDGPSQFRYIAEALPNDNVRIDIPSKEAELIKSLEILAPMPTCHDLIGVTRADVCFGIYRRLRSLHQPVKDRHLDLIVNAGMIAMEGARRLAESFQPWWQAVSVPFHFLCVLVSLDTTESLERALIAQQTLEFYAQQFPSDVTSEAVKTARTLIRASVARSRRKIDLLEKVQNSTPTTSAATPSDNIDFSEEEWNHIIDSAIFMDPMGHDVWGIFLNDEGISEGMQML